MTREDVKQVIVQTIVDITGYYITEENSDLREYIHSYSDKENKIVVKSADILHISLHEVMKYFPRRGNNSSTLKDLIDSFYIRVSKFVSIDIAPNDRKLCYIGVGKLPYLEEEHRIMYPSAIKYADYNRLPTGFEFRNLQRDTLYVMHPLDDKVYVPFEGSDVFFLQERIRDFIMFSAALGAKRVRATAKVKHSEVSRSTSDTSVSGSAGNKMFGASVNYNSSSSNYESLAMSSAFNFEREFEGIARPEVLEKLPWYKHESSWHQIQQERELFGTKRLMESISTSTTRIVNSSNIEKIKGDVKILLAKASGSYEKAVTQMLETQDDLIETIEVEF